MAAGDCAQGEQWAEDVTADVVVPYPDYSVPIERPYVTVGVYVADGSLLINATDHLLIAVGDKLLIRGGSQIQSPRVDVPYPDYSIPVPEPEWSNG